MGASKKNIALAVCSGCGIGDCINVEKLNQVVSEAENVIPCLNHAALCSEEGLEQLLKFSNEGEVDRMAIAACSPRVKSEQFNLQGLYVERINLREQIAWVTEPGEENTQMFAEDQVRMVLAKLDSISDIAPYIPETLSSDILVVGGGIAGLSAALEGAEAGYQIHLVEKAKNLGGYARRLYKLLPTIQDQNRLGEPDSQALIEKVLAHSNVEVHLNSRLGTISGEPGNFSVALHNESEKSLVVGSIVTSTGWSTYDAEKLGHLGYGSPHVKTMEEFEKHVQKEKVPDRVLFILCAGSRDEKHLSYCSTYCCSAALKQALYVREKNPDSQVYIIYRDIRTTGFQEEFYKMVQ